jgi:hypothetical protein
MVFISMHSDGIEEQELESFLSTVRVQLYMSIDNELCVLC